MLRGPVMAPARPSRMKLAVLVTFLVYAIQLSNAQDCGFKPSSEYLGDEVKTVYNTLSQAACCDACSSDARCKFWTRSKSDGKCVLKADKGIWAFKDNKATDSGSSRSTGCQVKQNTASDGKTFKKLQGTTSTAACCGACSSDPTCVSWTRHQQSGDCYLKSNWGKLRSDDNYDTGSSRLGGCNVRTQNDYGVGGTELTVIENTPNIATCCESCSINPDCFYFTRSRLSGNCYLKGGQGNEMFFSSTADDSGTSRGS